jgi:uncharacterized protein YecT (DUF1311 family)
MDTISRSNGITERTYVGAVDRRCCCDQGYGLVYYPAPDAHGDYQGMTLCDRWEVVDTQGPLNGRMDFKFPLKNYDCMDAKWPEKNDMDINNWKDTAHFMQGSVLTAAMGNMGAMIVTDRDGKPWLLVRDNNPADPTDVVLVRANNKYIRPAIIETQYDMNVAESERLKDAQGNLEKVLDNLLTASHEASPAPEQAKEGTLRYAQERWNEFALADAKAVAKPYEGGSIYPLMYMNELESATRARTGELEERLEKMRQS